MQTLSFCPAMFMYPDVKRLALKRICDQYLSRMASHIFSSHPDPISSLMDERMIGTYCAVVLKTKRETGLQITER